MLKNKILTKSRRIVCPLIRFIKIKNDDIIQKLNKFYLLKLNENSNKTSFNKSIVKNYTKINNATLKKTETSTILKNATNSSRNQRINSTTNLHFFENIWKNNYENNITELIKDIFLFMTSFLTVLLILIASKNKSKDFYEFFINLSRKNRTNKNKYIDDQNIFNNELKPSSEIPNIDQNESTSDINQNEQTHLNTCGINIKCECIKGCHIRYCICRKPKLRCSDNCHKSKKKISECTNK